MIYTKHRLNIAIMTICLLLPCVRLSIADQMPERQAMLCNYAYSVCPRIGCHLVIEDLNSGRLVSTYVSDNQDITSTKEIAEFFRKELGGVEVSILPHQVVLIKDISLVKDRNYPLDRVVSLDYSGNIDSLSDAIGDRLDGSVEAMDAGSISMINNYDYTSLITLSARNETVRSILTNHLPITHYRAILWDARTAIRNRKEVTYINFWRP